MGLRNHDNVSGARIRPREIHMRVARFLHVVLKAPMPDEANTRCIWEVALGPGNFRRPEGSEFGIRQPDSEADEEPGAGEGRRPNAHVLHGPRSAPFLGRRRGVLELEPLVLLLELQERFLEPLPGVEVGDLGAPAPGEEEGDGDEPAGCDGHEGA